MKKQNGITLIALIITIIVMLILVGVTVNVALNGGLFDAAKQAVAGMNIAQIKERALMTQVELMADMKTTEDIIVVTQEFKNRLATEFGVTENEIVGNKVVVADGKYDIIVKNSDLDIEVKEHNDYVNINSIITPNISYETTAEEEMVIGANFNLDLVLNLSSSAYVTLRKQEAIDKTAVTTYEEKTEAVLESLSTDTNTEITSIDNYFLLCVNSLLERNGLDTHELLEDCLEDEIVRAEAGIAEDEDFKKGHIYNYFINGDVSQELTEQQVIEIYYNRNIINPTINANAYEYANEHRYATQNLTIILKKDGTEIETKSKSVSSLIDGNEYSFEVLENGTYEVSIINKTTGEDILIQEEKIVVNNIRDIENAISTDEAKGIWTSGNGRITGYTGTETNVTVPKYIGTEKITTIGGSMASVFKEYVNSVTLPDSVTLIGTSAFARCKGLTNVTIPNSVTSIGTSAFYGCTGLTSITIPNSVISIENDAFDGCTGLTSITIPNSVTSIGNKAFYGCKGLTEITISNSLTSIEDYVFYDCRGLTQITIPNSVTSIGDYAFGNCVDLREITIPNSVISIGNETFNNCKELTQITIPNSVTSIGDEAFIFCDKLKNIYLEAGSTLTIPETQPWGARYATVTEIDPPTAE